MRCPPYRPNAVDRAPDLGVAICVREGIDETHIERGLTAFARDLEHVVDARIDTAAAQLFGAFREGLDVGLERFACGRGDNLRLAGCDSRARQVEHVRRLHVGDAAEHRQKLRQVDEFREAGVHAVAGAVGRQFERGYGLREIRRPGVEMRDAAVLQKIRTEIAEHRVHFGHGVRDRRAGGEDDAAAAGQLADVAGLHVHIEGAVAVRIRQAGDAVHFRRVEQILVGSASSTKSLVDAEFLEGDRVVFPFAVGALLELRDEALLGFLQFLDDPAIVTAFGLGLEDGVFELLHLVVDEAVEELVRDRQKLERAVRDDHGVVVAARNAGHRALPVAGREMVPARDEEPGLGIELQEFRSPLLDQMVGHDEHGLFGKAQTAHFHSGGRHRPGLSRADNMGEQRAAALQDAPDRVLLVTGQVMVAQRLADHARKGQMRSVECAQAQIVEAVVVLARQARSAFGVLPDPFAEAVLDLLLLLARGDGFLLVDDARAIVPLVIGGRRASVESILDKVGGAEARGAVGRGVADVPTLPRN